MLGRRGFSLESVAARICTEAKGRVRTNMFVRDMDLAVPGVPDSRRLEVVVDGLPLRGGAQLALDTTLVCALHADGLPDVTQLKGMEWRSRRQNGRKWPLTQSSWARTAAPSLWCWRWRLAAVGLGRRGGSLVSWRAPVHEKKFHSSDIEQSRPGDSGGERCLDVLLRRTVASSLLSSTVMGVMGETQHHMMWTGTTDTLGSARELRSCVGETWFLFLW